MTYDPKPRFVAWLDEWQRHVEPARQKAYVKAELLRLAASDEPLLNAALMAPLPRQTDVAVEVLRDQLEYGMVWLRLVPGAPTPPTDPDGRPLDEKDRGRVLVAKVGVRGQTADGKPPHHERETRETSALGRDALRTRRGESLYRTARVTAAPKAYPLADAIVILRQWGVGIAPEHMHRGNGAGGREKAPRWLVEEVPQRDGQPVLPEPAPMPAKAAKPDRAA